MKVLIATHETQGDDPGDYSWTVDGELVTVGSLECASPDRCGCGRGFCGLGNSRATTTALVVERPDITLEALRAAVLDWLERDGWTSVVDADDWPAMVDEYVHDITEVCAHFPVGSVVRRRGTKVFDTAAMPRPPPG